MDRQTELRKMHEANAISGPVVTSLKDILADMTKDRLNFIAANCALAGRSKLKKQELADALCEWITNPMNVRAAFIAADPQEWDLISKFIKVPFIRNNEVMPIDYLFLMDKGLVFTFLEHGDLFIVMPGEVRAAYKNLNRRSFEEERNVTQLVLRYIEAAANLYGICPVERLVAIINEQNDSNVTEAQLFQIQASVSDKALTWEIQRGLLLSDGLEGESLEDYEEFLESVKDKPYYIPPKEVLLRHADMEYFEMTPQLTALKLYIMQKLGKSEQQADALVDDIQLACSMEEPLEVIMEEFENRKIRLSKKQLEELIPLIIQVRNTTRMWSNRGYTPAELSPAPSSSTKTGNVVQFPAVSTKIGRNEPCPCGSGKKYKNCCL